VRSKKLKYVVKIYAKGKAYWYYRRGGVLLGRLRGGYMDTQWMADYAAIHTAYITQEPRQMASPLSFAGVARSYLKSAEYMQLKQSTRIDYRRYIDGILHDMFGPVPVDEIKRSHILAFRDKLADTPGKANACVRTIGIIMRYAHDRDYIDANPAKSIPALKGGHHAHWPMPAIERFTEAADDPLRRAFLFGLYTGQRLGDCTLATWKQIDDGGLWVKQEKTGTEVWIPLYPPLQAVIDECPRTAITILTDRVGKTWKRDTLKQSLRRVVLQLGLDGLSFHGLRKTASVMLAEAGCSNMEIKSITGHSGDQMVELYTRGARKKHLARRAVEKLNENSKVQNVKLLS